ncbi:MAG TPA: hypothetical protein VMF05_00145 [Stellaceae bacterium]|nr:hypothetical protein [Stellaceae bacterium]
MPMHKVEVDDEVFALVQSHAVPLVDSFNSALRRLLSSGELTKRKGQPAQTTGSVKDLEGYRHPHGTPQALSQVLDVVRLVHGGSDTRSEATRRIAATLDIAPQTVLDKYTRQLGLTAVQFDRLLAPERCEELRKLLHSKFPEHLNTIDHVFIMSRTVWNISRREHLLDIADRLFGPENGVELTIPHRGTLPSRPPPDFPELGQNR